jgi:hypothetical protein
MVVAVAAAVEMVQAILVELADSVVGREDMAIISVADDSAAAVVAVQVWAEAYS